MQLQLLLLTNIIFLFTKIWSENISGCCCSCCSKSYPRRRFCSALQCRRGTTTTVHMETAIHCTLIPFKSDYYVAIYRYIRVHCRQMWVLCLHGWEYRDCSMHAWVHDAYITNKYSFALKKSVNIIVLTYMCIITEIEHIHIWCRHVANGCIYAKNACYGWIYDVIIYYKHWLTVHTLTKCMLLLHLWRNHIL